MILKPSGIRVAILLYLIFSTHISQIAGQEPSGPNPNKFLRQEAQEDSAPSAVSAGSPTRRTAATKEWETIVSNAIGEVVLHPDAKDVFVLDIAAQEALAFEIGSGKIKFRFPSTNGTACYSADGRTICIAEFPDLKNSKAKLVNSETGEILSSIDGQFKGLLRRSPDPNIFFVRLADNQIGELNFSKKLLKVIFTPDDLTTAGAVPSLRDYEIRDSLLYALCSDCVFCYDLRVGKELWRKKTGMKLTLYLNAEGEVCTDSLSGKVPYQGYDAKTGDYSYELAMPVATWMLRNRKSNNLILIHDVMNVPQPGLFSKLEVVDLKGNLLGSTNISQHRCMRLSNVAKRNESLYFARVGWNGELQVWSISNN